jgi:hypothetical protein
MCYNTGCAAGEARIGRCRQCPLAAELALAFAMGTHPQLGPPCMADVLPEIVRLVVEMCGVWAWPEGWAGGLEGLVRLQGGGVRMRGQRRLRDRFDEGLRV